MTSKTWNFNMGAVMQSHGWLCAAVFGAPHGTLIPNSTSRSCATAAALRDALREDALVGELDFVDGLAGGDAASAADLGDLETTPLTVRAIAPDPCLHSRSRAGAFR
jgi:hypothetical protein